MKPSKELEKLAEDLMRVTFKAIEEHSTKGKVGIALGKEYKTTSDSLNEKFKEEGLSSMELHDLLMKASDRVTKGEQ
jgi:hypothetical protein